jgi:hypothetical protein
MHIMSNCQTIQHFVILGNLFLFEFLAKKYRGTGQEETKDLPTVGLGLDYVCSVDLMLAVSTPQISSKQAHVSPSFTASSLIVR